RDPKIDCLQRRLEDDSSMKTNLVRVLAAVLTIGLLAGCGGRPQDAYQKEPATPSAPEPVATLKIGQIPTIDGLPFWVAQSKDYYRQQGVEVELVRFKS